MAPSDGPRDGPPAPARAILHVDLDAFYAAVEILEDPSLAGRPVVVGGSGNRGVVASASYQARAFGIRSAMPSVQARRLCPHAVFVPGRYALYSEFSRRLHVLFRTVTPAVEPIGLDEAFLDVTGARRLLGEPTSIAWRLRARIHDELGLWASVGVSAVKNLAKLASEAAKPVAGPPGAGPRPGLGVKVVEPGDELAFLHPLPVRALWGVGPATDKRLARFGVATVGELAAVPLASLIAAVGEAHGRHLHDLAWARDPRRVEPDRDMRSIGHEETYPHDHHDRDTLGREVVRLSDGVASRLAAAGVAGRTITLKVRFADFRTITRSKTVRDPIATGSQVARVARALLGGVDPSPGVRLLGVSASNLVERPSVQLDLAAAAGGTGRRGPAAELGLGGAVDEVRRRFGEAAVGPAALLSGPGFRLRRLGDHPWGPG